jgi:outer membrane murein-binding lipoprotein Lpp
MKLKVTLLVIAMTYLSGCASTVYKTELEIYCPNIVKYNQDFNNKLADEIESLPDTNGNLAIVDALSDYASLRDKIRACQKERDKE